jgi:3-dehydroquinate dehydratase I
LRQVRLRFPPTANIKKILESAKESPLVCTTILARDKASFLETARKAAQLGCDIAELRIDHLKSPSVSLIGKIIDESLLPLIVTNRSARHGGLFAEDREFSRLSLIESSLNFYPAFVDIEYDLPNAKRKELIKKAGKKGVGVICSHHDFSSTPSIAEILDLAARISVTGVAISKLVFVPRDGDEVLRILKAANLLSSSKQMFAVFGMGSVGQMSRAATLLFGSCLIYCSLGRTDNKLGQISLENARSYIASLNTYGWQKIRDRRERLLPILEKELRQNKTVDFRFDPMAALRECD